MGTIRDEVGRCDKSNCEIIWSDVVVKSRTLFSRIILREKWVKINLFCKCIENLPNKEKEEYVGYKEYMHRLSKREIQRISTKSYNCFTFEKNVKTNGYLIITQHIVSVYKNHKCINKSTFFYEQDEIIIVLSLELQMRIFWFVANQLLQY